MKVFFALSTSAILLGVAVAQSNNCPLEGIHRFPDFLNESCGRYTICDSGISYYGNCYNGYHFSPHTLECAVPQDAHCAIGQPLCPRWPQAGGSDPVVEPYLADGNNCHNFYECHDGEAVPGNCPPGLVYDRHNHACSETAECLVRTEIDFQLAYYLINSYRCLSVILLELLYERKRPVPR